jgi:hypothetical protein
VTATRRALADAHRQLTGALWVVGDVTNLLTTTTTVGRRDPVAMSVRAVGLALDDALQALGDRVEREGGSR